jgi:pimeloyl-ACP methyl ester carboxylesterase
MHSVITGLFLPSLLNGKYTLQERLNLWIGKVSSLWDTKLATDLSSVVTELRTPVYFLHGIHAYTCSYLEAKSYFDPLKAPVKDFYTFWNSAHSPHFEEPQRMQKILETDVLQGTDSLADKP